MKNILTFLVLIILLLSIQNCEKSTTSPDSSSNNPAYVPGQVLSGFADTVSYNFIINFLDTLNLEILDVDLGHNFWAIADSNDLEYYQDIFSNDSTVEFVDELPSRSSTDTLIITITFTGMNTLEADLVKVESIGLNVYDIKKHPKTAVFGCEIGEENYWISWLLKCDFVRYAELNYVDHIF